MADIETNTRGQGHRIPASNKGWRIGVNFVTALVAGAALVGSIQYDNEVYQNNLDIIRSQAARNTNHDNSAYRDWKQTELVPTNHYSDNARQDYVNTFSNTTGNQEASFPLVQGGQFRTQCEFSHFAYDDPVLFPDRPGEAHLHMFFGNTDVNAYTTQETLEDSGGSTCNGSELNRSGYWAPAMFDGQGFVRIPERIMIYYKGEGRANADGPLGGPGSQLYERGMRNISPWPQGVTETPPSQGGDNGVLGSFSAQFPNGRPQAQFKCSDNFSSNVGTQTVGFIPVCDGNDPIFNCGGSANGGNYPACRNVLEVEVKFWNCFPNYNEANPNGPNPDVIDWTLWRAGDQGQNWFNSNCGPNAEIYPNFSYFINYVVEPGETTAGWFLSSDVDKASLATGNPQINVTRGSTTHGDAWWAWDPETLQMALDNCINFKDPSGAAAGCATGYLTNGGPDRLNPFPGPALEIRPDYDVKGQTSSYKTFVNNIWNTLCVPHGPSHSFNNDDRNAAHCL